MELDLLTATDAGRLVDRSADTMRRWANEGRVRVIRSSDGTRLFRRADIMKLAATIRETDAPVRATT